MREKKTFLKRRWVWVVGAILLIGLIGSFFDQEKLKPELEVPETAKASTEPKEEAAEKDKKVENPVAKVEKEKPKEESVEKEKQEPAEDTTFGKKAVVAIINKELGKKTNTKHKRIIELQVNDNMGTIEEGDKIVIAKLYGNENVTDNYTRKGLLMDSKKLLQALYSHKEITDVAIMWQLPLTDSSGKASLDTVVKLGVEKATADKIQWDNFNYNDFEQVADSYFVHPALETK